MFTKAFRQASCALLLIGMLPEAAAAASLAGVVESGDSRIVNAEVTLFRAGRAQGEQAVVLGKAASGSDGGFSITYTPPRPNDVIYATALGGVPIAGGGVSTNSTTTQFI